MPSPPVPLDLTVGGLERSALAWLPATTRGAALVLDLHGSGFDAARHVAVTGSPAWVDDHDAVVVAPTAALPLQFKGVQQPGFAWSIPGVPLFGVPPGTATREVDDTAYLAGLVEQAHREWGTDPARVFALGWSGGARLLSHWAAQQGCPVTRVVCVSGVRTPPGAPTARLLALHGARDQINPWDGLDQPRWAESVPMAAQAWADALGAKSLVRQASQAGEVTTWLADDDSVVARLHRLAGVGHAWPGTADAEQRRLFGDAGSVRATDVAADFLFA
jgi:polyhydroxybutyrate depolymerase